MHKADTKFLSNCNQSLLRYQYFYFSETCNLITAARNNSQPHIMKHFITQWIGYKIDLESYLWLNAESMQCISKLGIQTAAETNSAY